MPSRIPHLSTDYELQHFINRYASEISNNNAAVFAGAGLSVASGYVNWKELLRSVADELQLDINQEADRLIAVAQYHHNQRNSRATLNQLLIDKFSAGHAINENHRILARLPIQTYWTTNYDRLIERALEQAGKVVDTKYKIAQLSTTKSRRDAIVYKMHGDVEHPDEAVLTKDDYERYHLERGGAFINLLSGDLVSKTFVFLGFSFSDPNIDYVLARVRATWKQHQREHWCIARTVERDKKDTTKTLEYKRLKQYYFVKDLERFNIRTLLVDDYATVTALLQRIENVFRSNTIFISGSADEFGAWPQQQAEEFLAKLSASLVKADRNIVTGFGLGVGSAVVSGALNEILADQSRRSMSQLIMRPFPQVAGKNEAVRRGLWTKYREEMIAYAGAIIVVFGNRQSRGKTLPADGVKEEFDIARSAGLKPIPIGATGYVADELHHRVVSDFDAFYPSAPKGLRKSIESLGDKNASPEVLLQRVLRAVQLIQKA